MWNEFLNCVRRWLIEIIFTVAVAVLVILLWVSFVRSAPAPFQRKEKVEQEKHPVWMCGEHVLTYAGQFYQVDLKDDGTLYVRSAHDAEFRWRGTWGIKNGILYWREWSWPMYRTCPPQWNWELTFYGFGWKCSCASLQRELKPTD